VAGRPPAVLDLGRYPGAAPPSRPRIRELEGRDALGTAATHFVGIDVSKATLDCCLLAPGGGARARAFPNTPATFAALAAWADRHAGGAPNHFGMEASGGYEDAPTAHLHAAGRLASDVNPTRVKYAGLVRGRGNKPDRTDARLIAQYTRDHCPRPGPRPRRKSENYKP
jgi:transposase